jgi:SAM-dependent methyltransferase
MKAARSAKTIAPMFVLDAPHFHMVTLGATETFRGVALAPGDVSIAEVVAYRDGTPIARTPVDIASPELGWIPAPHSSQCRFSFDLTVERGAAIELHVRYVDGQDVPVFVYDVPLLERDEASLRALAQCIRAKPAPPSDVIATTQGLGDVDSYRASTATSFMTMRSLLGAAGVETSGIRSILDVGCGTGRLLVGWHCDDPRRELVGTDINPGLIAWCRSNLGDVARWELNGVQPPFEGASASFDLIVLASVFTHLSLDNQRAWLEEIRRLLGPAGHALITLHGEIYAGLVLDEESAERYDADGYVEKAVGAQGANSYSTFHAEAFARELFSRFSRVTFFPRGAEGAVARAFPVAAQQDVYVLAK